MHPHPTILSLSTMCPGVPILRTSRQRNGSKNSRESSTWDMKNCATPFSPIRNGWVYYLQVPNLLRGRKAFRIGIHFHSFKKNYLHARRKYLLHTPPIPTLKLTASFRAWKIWVNSTIH